MTKPWGLRLLAVVAALAVANLSQAQTPTNLTIQQPTFRNFRVSTSVYVPAGGSLSLGGIGRSSQGMNRFGFPLGGRFPGLGNRALGNQALGGVTTAGSLSIHTTVIDHAAMDRALLAEAARRRGATHDVLGRPINVVPSTSNARVGQHRVNQNQRSAPSAETLWRRGF